MRGGVSVREHDEANEPRCLNFSVFPSITRGNGEQEGRQEKSFAISGVPWRSVEQKRPAGKCSAVAGWQSAPAKPEG